MTGSDHSWDSATCDDGFLKCHAALDIEEHCSFGLGSTSSIDEDICCDERHQSVWVDEATALIDDSDAVAVTIHSNSELAALLDYRRCEVKHILLARRVGRVVGECIVPFAMDGHEVDA